MTVDVAMESSRIDVADTSMSESAVIRVTQELLPCCGGCL